MLTAQATVQSTYWVVVDIHTQHIKVLANWGMYFCYSWLIIYLVSQYLFPAKCFDHSYVPQHLTHQSQATVLGRHQINTGRLYGSSSSGGGGSSSSSGGGSSRERRNNPLAQLAGHHVG